MNKLHAIIATAALGLSVHAFAQEGDAARQQRMDEAYAKSRNTQVADSGVREDVHKAGHAVHEGVKATGHAVHTGVKATGHAVHQGVKATGHAIHQGVRATGHAIHKGVDAVTK
ncbi:MAG TPA: hypothetical protein VIP05_01315 [Burkholderiaceae bacterium]